MAVIWDNLVFREGEWPGPLYCESSPVTYTGHFTILCFSFPR